MWQSREHLILRKWPLKAFTFTKYIDQQCRFHWSFSRDIVIVIVYVAFKLLHGFSYKTTTCPFDIRHHFITEISNIQYAFLPN